MTDSSESTEQTTDEELLKILEEEEKRGSLIKKEEEDDREIATNHLLTGKSKYGFHLPLSPLALILNNNKYELNMTKLLTGALFCWSLAHLIRNTLFSAKSVVIREASPPSPFFPHSSNGLVHDFYNGSIEEPALLMARAEFTIMMLYAPWDSRSKAFRKIFLQVAKSLQPMRAHIRFVAANCHYHRGRCRRNYKLLSYPLIFAQTPFGQPIVFNEIHSRQRLFSWILYILSPLRIHRSIDECSASRYKSDFQIIGHFSLQYSRLPSLARPYNVFLNSAMKAANSRSSLAFGLIQNRELASALGLQPAQLHFHTFYDHSPSEPVATFHIGEQTKSQEILNWANGCIHKYQQKAVYELDMEDLESPGKLEVLWQKINSSAATIVLFTDIFGLPQQSSSLITLKNLAKIFHDCEATEANCRVGDFQGGTLDEFFKKTKKMCSLKPFQFDQCCEQIECEPWERSRRPSERDGQEGKDEEEEHCFAALSSFFSFDLFKRRCCAERRMRRKRKRTEEENWKNGTTTTGKGKGHDPFGMEWRQKMACKLNKMAGKNYIYEEKGEEERKKEEEEENGMDVVSRLAGMGCGKREKGGVEWRPNRNTSIGFMAIDRRQGQHFVQNWGGPHHHRAASSAGSMTDSVAIIAREAEEIFWMDLGRRGEHINLRTLAGFLLDFLNANLTAMQKNQRLMREEGRNGKEIEKKRKREKEAEEEEDGEGNTSLLGRLNRDKFIREIIDENADRAHDAVVFFSLGDWHAPSTTAVHFVHQAKMYFQQFQQYIKFYILDISQNSLPWAYKFTHLPAVVFFPARKFAPSSADARHLFPSGLAFSVPNLLAFILPRCQDQLKWRLAFTVCRQNCLARNFNKIGAALEMAESNMRWMRRSIRRSRKTTNVGRQNLKIHLKRCQMKRAMLIHLRSLLRILMREDHTGPPSSELQLLQRLASKEAELLAWFLLAGRTNTL